LLLYRYNDNVYRTRKIGVINARKLMLSESDMFYSSCNWCEKFVFTKDKYLNKRQQ
jgi:hypothetical protein